jgi:N-methylhydantoinase B
VNIALSTAVASVYVALKHLFTEVPANSGVLSPIEIIIPEGSLLNVKAPKPVGGYTETILRIIDVVFCTMANVAPERVNGCAYGTINALSLAGHRRDGSRWVLFSFFGGGHGGHPQGDGLNHGNAPISTATIPPAEILEAAYPVKFTKWALRPDSGGPGRHRGGLGALYEIELLEEVASVFLFGERGKFSPPGVLGGESGALNKFTYEQDDGVHSPLLSSKMNDIKLKKGQKLLLQTPGGGGYGTPCERDPDAVALDVSLGYVSRENAVRQYAVSINDDGTLNKKETHNLRKVS